ncbi:MAG: hypothetical protein KKH60_08705 [Proteobacteria bacterium]|nr:hypothetical protein [Pseudomonadota bacterium]
MSSRKGLTVPFISLVILLITCSSVCAATDWGTKGVSDTSKVTNVVQLTTDATATGLGKSYLMGGTWPEGNNDNIQPWRKDGEWIAFTAEVGGTGESYQEVCKIKPDGSSFTQLTTNAVKDSNASFSTDSKVYYNVYTSDLIAPNYSDRVWRMNENGLGQTDLSAVHSASDSDKAVVVSPDGSMIAYQVNSLLMVANSDGTVPVQVSGTYNAGASNISVAAGQYSWSPDSQWLVYSGYDTTGYFLYKVKPDSTSHTQLTSVGADLGNLSHLWPVWSPDSSKIAYLWRQYTSTVIVPNYKYFYELRTISSSDGTALKTLDTANSNMTVGWSELIAPASWSPDSIWLAYSKKWADTVSYKGIFIINTEDTTPTSAQLTTGFNDFFPIWAPDGSQLLFQSGYYQLSREDDTCSPSCTDRGDILLLNLIGDYGNNTTSSFPWPMFIPSIQKNGQQ